MQLHKALQMNLGDPRNWDTPAFPISVVAAAMGQNLNTVRSEFHRGNFRLQAKDCAAEKSGLPRLFTFRSSLILAATAELARAGLRSKVAFEAALDWGMCSDREMESRYCSSKPSRDREAAGCYDSPFRTILIYYPASARSEVLALEWVEGRGPVLPWGMIVGGGDQAATIFDLDKVALSVSGHCTAYLAEGAGQ